MLEWSDDELVAHPLHDAAYSSFVVEGLRRCGIALPLRYSYAEFPAGAVPPATLLLVAPRSGLGICVALDDDTQIEPALLEWSDVYAKVNIDPLLDAGSLRRLVPLGPTFAVRAWTVAGAVREQIARRRAGRAEKPAVGGRGFRAHLRRLPESAYTPGASERDYVFFAAWPWKKHSEVNEPRAHFIEACRAQAGLSFEGGFVPRRRNDVPEAVRLSAGRRYPIREYVRRVQRSAVAFSNPAVHGCLGWKLGEYLALGKAIISLPLERTLPAPLEHGEHLHYVDGSIASIDDALDRLRRNDDYRKGLERGARAYYEQWLRPERVALRLFGRGSS